MNAAVFDTNVIVSGLLTPRGAPGQLVEWLRLGACAAVVDDRVWSEYTEVLARPEFAFPASDVGLLLESVRAHAVWVTPDVRALGTGTTLLPDADDAPFLACARQAGVPLVTGNLRHFPQRVARDVEVLLPAVYLQRLQARDQSDS